MSEQSTSPRNDMFVCIGYLISQLGGHIKINFEALEEWNAEEFELFYNVNYRTEQFELIVRKKNVD